jgi:hypothetical protein
MNDNRRWKPLHALVAAACMVLSASAWAQAKYAAPEQAADALIEAISKQDEATLARVLGKEWRQVVPPGSVDPADRQAFLDKARQARKVEVKDGKGELQVGEDRWALPIPIVKAKDGQWQFDTRAGLEAIIDRRIGTNELSAIRAVQAYVDAQYEYAQADRNGDGVLEYARKFASSPGKRDGLIWSTKLGDESPLGEDFVPPKPGTGYHGYRFRILTGQGPHAKGGARSYLIGNRMVSGFALVAWPVAYGKTGIKSFIVNQEGVVYERDLGPGTATAVDKITTFEPDDGWSKL